MASATVERCLNCSLRLTPLMRRLMLSELPNNIINILRSWISPTPLSTEGILCHECFSLLQNALTSPGPLTPAVGHRAVCYGCGASILRSRSHRVPLDCPQRMILLRRVPFHQMTRLERVCLACWMTATRTIQRQKTEDVDRDSCSSKVVEYNLMQADIESVDSCSSKVVEYNLMQGDIESVVLKVEDPLKENNVGSTSLDGSEEKQQARLNEMTEEISQENSQPQNYMEVNEEIYENHQDNSNQQCDNQNVTKGQVSNALPTTMDDSTFDITVKPKQENRIDEHSVQKTPEKYLDMLLNVQKLGSEEWAEFKYAEIENLYAHSPGFVELETNDEVKSCDTLNFLAQTERSYAALTFCILKQQEAFQDFFVQNALALAEDTGMNQEILTDKMLEVFQNTDYKKITSDLMELVCGFRAEIIKTRRDTVTNKLKNSVIKDAVKKIHPSVTHIFEPHLFTSVMENSGGVNQDFSPLPEEKIPKTEPSNFEYESQIGDDEQSIDNPPSQNGDEYDDQFSIDDPPSQIKEQYDDQSSNDIDRRNLRKRRRRCSNVPETNQIIIQFSDSDCDENRISINSELEVVSNIDQIKGPTAKRRKIQNSGDSLLFLKEEIECTENTENQLPIYVEDNIT